VVQRSPRIFRSGGSLGTVSKRWLDRFKKMLTNANMTFARLWYLYWRTNRTNVVYPIGSDSVILVVRDQEGLIAPIGDPKNSRHFHFCRA